MELERLNSIPGKSGLQKADRESKQGDAQHT